MGTQLLPPQKGTSPEFSAHVRCDQMAGWMKMPLATVVGLTPGDIVIDGDPALPPAKSKAHQPPIIGPCIVAKRLDESRRHLVRRWASTQATLC